MRNVQYKRTAFFFISHARAFRTSLHSLRQHFVSYGIAGIAMGITIAVPVTLYLLLSNFQLITNQWSSKPGLSIYLKDHVAQGAVDELMQRMREQDNVLRVEYISPEQGLQDFKRYAEFTDVIPVLKHNPLPPVINVTFTKLEQGMEGITRLLERLKMSPYVDQTSADATWMIRLNFIVMISKRVALALTLLLGAGVILAMSNAIRLVTHSHRHETHILSLVGATQAYIRRPFLYRGLLYGVLGGGVAWILAKCALMWTMPPLLSLLATYGETAGFNEANVVTGLLIIGSASALSVMGSWVAVQKQLSKRG